VRAEPEANDAADHRIRLTTRAVWLRACARRASVGLRAPSAHTAYRIWRARAPRWTWPSDSSMRRVRGYLSSTCRGAWARVTIEL
jgi:hypothetical protein